MTRPSRFGRLVHFLGIVIAGAALCALPVPARAQSLTAAIKACADQRTQATRASDAEKRKQQIDAKTQFDIDIRNCGTNSACKRAATDTYRDAIREIANENARAVADIRKTEVDCQQAARNGSPSGGQPVDDATNVPPAARDQMMRLRAEVDNILARPSANALVAADQFFRGLLDWGTATLGALAQRPGLPVEQLVDYLVNHRPESFSQQRQRAEQALRDFQNNPARFIGRNAPNFLPMPAGQTAAGANRAVSAGRRLTQVNAEANRFAPVATRALTPARTVPSRVVDIGPPPLAGRGSVQPPAVRTPGATPPWGNQPSTPRSGIPPTCFENQCVRNVQAVADFWETGVWNEPTPRGYPFVEELADLPTPGAQVIADLRRRYGGPTAKDPLHGDVGQLAHSMGVPVAATRESIENAMRTIGPGAQGRVFVRWEQTVGGEVVGGRHAVNVRTLPDRTIQFYDRATAGVAGLEGAVEPWLWQSAREIFFYRTH